MHLDMERVQAPSIPAFAKTSQHRCTSLWRACGTALQPVERRSMARKSGVRLKALAQSLLGKEASLKLFLPLTGSFVVRSPNLPRDTVAKELPTTLPEVLLSSDRIACNVTKSARSQVGHVVRYGLTVLDSRIYPPQTRIVFRILSAISRNVATP